MRTMNRVGTRNLKIYEFSLLLAFWKNPINNSLLIIQTIDWTGQEVVKDWKLGA